MNWLASVAVGAITAAAGAVSAGIVALLAVEWYRVSSREGGSGYFVLMIALLAMVVGFILGVAGSRFFAIGSIAGFAKACGVLAGLLVGVVAVTGTIARLLADVPPTIDGETLYLVVEVKLPEAPKQSKFYPFLRLGATSMQRVVRVGERGPLWLDEAKLVDGEWIATGAVRVFTSRGERLLEIGLAAEKNQFVVVPLPAYPGKAQMAWSEWLPRNRNLKVMSYRFRVARASEPLHVQKIGVFEVPTITRQFSETVRDNLPAIASEDEYRLRYRGEPVRLRGTVGELHLDSETVATIASFRGCDNVLLVASPDYYFIVYEKDGRAMSEPVSPLYGMGAVVELEGDGGAPEQFSSRSRQSFAGCGLVLAGGKAVIDPVARKGYPFDEAPDVSWNSNVAPLGVSPDRRSLVRYGTVQTTPYRPLLLVTDFVSNRTAIIPIDEKRTRFHSSDQLDPAWVRHYYQWVGDELVERRGVAPLAHEGKVTKDSSGLWEYRLHGATAGLHAALIEFVQREFSGVLAPVGQLPQYREVSVNGQQVHVSYDADSRRVSVYVDYGGEASVVKTIGAKFNLELQKETLDALFVE